MSVILDALRKLDREKTLRRGGTPDIASEILKSGLPRERRRVVLYLAVVFLATAAMTYAMVVKFGFPSKSSPGGSVKRSSPIQQASPALPKSAPLPKSSSPASVEPSPPRQHVSPAASDSPVPSKPSPPPPAETPALSQQVSPAPSEPVSVSKSLPPPPVSPAVPSQQVSSAPVEPAAVSKPLSPASPVSPAPGQQISAAPLLREPVSDARDETGIAHPKIESGAERQAPSTPTAATKTTPRVNPEEARVAPEIAQKPPKGTLSGSATTPPALKISGIVWSEDRSNRLAVINGVTVTEGTMIEGVKVVEIYPTRVRFLHNESSFEVPLGSATVIRR